MARMSLNSLAAHFVAMSREMPSLKHEALTKVAEFAEKDAKGRFGVYQPAPPVDWAPLAETTQTSRVAKGYSADEPLLASGSLRDSLGHTVDDKAHIGTNDPRMAWMEQGTSRMPPRPVLQATLLQKGPEMAEIAGGALFGKLEVRKRN